MNECIAHERGADRVRARRHRRAGGRRRPAARRSLRVASTARRSRAGMQSTDDHPRVARHGPRRRRRARRRRADPDRHPDARPSATCTTRRGSRWSTDDGEDGHRRRSAFVGIGPASEKVQQPVDRRAARRRRQHRCESATSSSPCRSAWCRSPRPPSARGARSERPDQRGRRRPARRRDRRASTRSRSRTRRRASSG